MEDKKKLELIKGGAAEDTGQCAEQRSEDFLLSHLETWEHLRGLDVHIEWVVDRLIPRNSVTVIHGKGGVGKTWIALDMARNIGSGTKFAGHATVKTPVVYVDFENPLSVLCARMKKLGSGGGVHIWREHNAELKPPKLDSNEWAEYKRVPDGSVLIFDTLRASHSGDENSSTSIGVIMGRLKELRDMGNTVIVLHHSPKSSDAIAKGSTAITDLCDHTLSLVRPEREDSDGPGDAGDSKNAVYYFGAKGKTRYARYGTCLAFNPDKGFELTPDPKDSRKNDALGEMFRVLLEAAEMNKTDFLRSCGEAKIGSRQELTNLFAAGTEKYWTIEKGAHNTHHVKPVRFSSLSGSYSSEKLENCEEAAAGADSNSDIPADGNAESEVSASPQANGAEEVSFADSPVMEITAEPESSVGLNEETAEEQSHIEDRTPSLESGESVSPDLKEDGSEDKSPADTDPDDEDVDFSEVRRLVAEVSEKTVTEEDDE